MECRALGAAGRRRGGGGAAAARGARHRWLNLQQGNGGVTAGPATRIGLY